MVTPTIATPWCEVKADSKDSPTVATLVHDVKADSSDSAATLRGPDGNTDDSDSVVRG